MLPVVPVCRASSAKSSIESAGLVGTAERSFLTPKESKEMESNVPSLDEFDTEVDIYRVSRKAQLLSALLTVL